MYLSWNEKTITDFSDANVTDLYNDGYVFTRVDKGVMKKTRSIRIDLSRFTLSSENRRILKKTESLGYILSPIPYTRYHWSIGKLAKDFYDTKFGPSTFSANKIKEILTLPEKSNFNRLFVYTSEEKVVGYCIAYETPEIMHYSYPFYVLDTTQRDTGLGMMLRAILYTREQKKKYLYLGSAQRPTDTYKLQFAGVEWFDGKMWQTNIEAIKNILSKQ